MKKIYALLSLCLLTYATGFAGTRYWVGIDNSSWNNNLNWSDTRGGAGGAGRPGPSDSAYFTSNAAVRVDVFTTINSLFISASSVTMHTTTGASITILNYFSLGFSSFYMLTNEDVPFRMVFNGATHATADIFGTWNFLGLVRVTGQAGSTFVAQPGSLVSVRSPISTDINNPFTPRTGRIIFGNNTYPVSSDASSLRFMFNTDYVLDYDLDAVIPNATWYGDSLTPVSLQFPVPRLVAPGANININGAIGQIKYLTPSQSYPKTIVNLIYLLTDASLQLPNGSNFTELQFLSTNDHTLTLLGDTSATSLVTVGAGALTVNGNTTQLALARSTSAAPAMSYRLAVGFYNQTGGNFSLQEDNNAQGSSTLAIKRDLTQTGGTFFTNSTSINPAAKFVVEMNGPEFTFSRPFGTASTGQSITMSSGTIDNGRNRVTLRLNNVLLGYGGYFFIDLGVTLKSPLTVGRLELLKGTLNTTDSTLVTVTDPVATTGIVMGTPGESYVVGPLRRFTQSTEPYLFPTGRKAAFFIYDFFHPCTVIPAANTLSAYQAEYFNSPYSDLNVTPPLKGVSNTEYWNIAKISGADARVVLPLKAAVPGASAADGIVVAHYVNGHWISEQGTVIKPGTAESGSVVSKPLSEFSPFTFGYATVPEDPVKPSGNCPKDTTFYTDAVNCMAKVGWALPPPVYPDSFNIANGGKLRFKGMFGGHGYYASTGGYLWPQARTIAANLGGHLVTITSAAENSFVVNNVVDKVNRGFDWIGLSSTGTPGQFNWVTNEPLVYTNWLPGQPDNLYGLNSSTTVFEPYVQIFGYDNDLRWNDNGNTAARFVAEFDSSLVTYRQYSGPANGAMLSPGVYTVCYEITQRATGMRDSCCFNVTVVCSRPVSTKCPKDTTITADASNCMAKASWTPPSPVYPDSFNIANGGMLRFKGMFGGHGYYASTGGYLWPQARTIAANLGGHLVTITSAAENSFVVNNVVDKVNRGFDWIGLSSTGTPGQFNWVTNEPLVYTNWLPGQPDNLYGLNSSTTVFEPYVQIFGYDNDLRWNDNGNTAARFVAEFDSSLVTYRQYSGPANGAMLGKGVYTVCYELTDRTTGKRDSCCFNITIVCNNTLTTAAEGNKRGKEVVDMSLHAFTVVAYPNPSASSFSLKINTDNRTDKIRLEITDATGKVIEIREYAGTDNLLQFGSRYATGIYFARLTQGSQVLMTKLVKE